MSAQAKRKATIIEDAVLTILQEIEGKSTLRPGLEETPARVARAYAEWFGGYAQSISSLFKTFEDGAEGCNSMIVLEAIPIQSHCEHHMAPFIGTAVVGYIPDGRILGLSKIPKLVNAFAKRLQVQERLTNQIADALTAHLAPKGAGVIIRAEHFCMATRGVHVPGVITTTSALRGVFLEPGAREEFLQFAK